MDTDPDRSHAANDGSTAGSHAHFHTAGDAGGAGRPTSRSNGSRLATTPSSADGSLSNSSARQSWTMIQLRSCPMPQEGLLLPTGKSTPHCVVPAAIVKYYQNL